MAKKPRLEEEMEEINIMPLMNIIMLLIPFLIMSTEFIKIGVINVAAPKIGGGAASSEPKKKNEKPPLNLTVSVTEKGFTILTRGKKIPEGCDLKGEATEAKLPTVKKIGDKYNLPVLKQCLQKIKEVFPDERRVIIMAEPEIRYAVIVEVMDNSREIKAEKELFPEVVLSAGVL
ncbi:MAG: biopolymer transporter ExbD [Myxococcales bacterium]|nr:biopolymer transporter ExbD [Myxococcales bacterium]